MSGPAREVEGLVVGGVDYGEADRIVHLLTSHGKLSAFAHGARKSRRRFSGALELFTSIRASLSQRSGADAMPAMTSAVVLKARLGLRDDLGKIALASYAVELGAAVAPEGEESADLHALVAEMLDRLLAQPARIALRRAFELRLIVLLGYRPELDRCFVCGRRPSPTYLDLPRGGVVCREHAEHAHEIGPKTLAWTRSVLDQAPSAPLDEDGGLDREAADRAARTLARPMMEHFASLLSRPLRSLALLSEVSL